MTDTRYKFKDYYLLWTNCIIFLVLVIHVLAELGRGDVRMAWVAAAIWGGLLILRFFFVVVPPKEIYIFASSRVLRIIPGKLWRENVEISLHGLLSVERSITIGRFPMVRVCLRFNDGRIEEIYFRPRLKSSGFFSFYSEEAPEEVNDFIIDLKHYEESNK